MPSYALNQCIDLDEVLSKQFLSLDLREPPKTSALHASSVGYRKPGTSCSPSSGSGLSPLGTESVSLTSSHWRQSREHSPSSRWNKMSFWTERSVSMVESNTGGFSWASSETSHGQQAAVTPNSFSVTSSASSGAAPTPSSRYKTELCRTYTERGTCKYGAKCQFAHGQEELRDLNRHPKYKTEPCRTFHSIGFCPYGIRCHFVHNNEDDLAHARPKNQTSRPPAQRPPLLKQSFSFAGFPSNPAPLDLSLPPPFLRAPSVSSPNSATISDLLSLAFPDLDRAGDLEQAPEPQPQFLPSPDSGCSNCGLTPTLSPSHNPLGQTEGCLRRSPGAGSSMGGRCLSHTSLSDQESGTGSSASSLSGSDSSCSYDAPGRRLPIFSQLSVPDEGFFSESSNGTSFFL
ncbi:mRNA decay activator protein ZFP36 [Chanos chanos]|uniref:mRNA decay activator protein ZFP36 n=1 Tax=Chanos chanos TaxID=29144 RepID=A0A6J2VNQ1_CHACN|nr:mRNA decay activator protein ZFP36-like [Chanos chanos]